MTEKDVTSGFSRIKSLFESFDPKPPRKFPLKFDTRNKNLGDGTRSYIEKHVDRSDLYVQIGNFRFDISEGDEVSFLVSPPITIQEEGAKRKRPGYIRFYGSLMGRVAPVFVDWATTCFDEDKLVDFPFPIDPDTSQITK